MGERTATTRNFTVRRMALSEALGGEPPKRWSAKLTHPTWRLVADRCPRCGFPEAEGGYCENCGWSAPIRAGRVV